jgi:hypothetical protein
MRIYNVRFDLRYSTKFIKERISENNDKRSLEEKIDVDEMEIDDEDNDNHFQVGATDLAKAYLEAQDYLEMIFEDDEAIEDWDITGVNLIDLDIVNWPGDNEEDCQCLHCRTERAAPEDRLKFTHVCGQEVEIVADGWEQISCENPKCHDQIYRDRIIGSNGNYLYLNIDNIDKENKDVS